MGNHLNVSSECVVACIIDLLRDCCVYVVGGLVMKITEIKSFPVRAGERNLFVLKIETDEGFHGWGEAGVSGRELAVKGAVSHFREFLIGKDPMQIGALWQEMYRGQYFEGGRILTGAISAIDIALYDLVARKLGVPVSVSYTHLTLPTKA